MAISPSEFDVTLDSFLEAWSIDKVKSMSIEEYADLNDHDSFCYWLEYRSKKIGAIGGIALNKFELWKPKEKKETKDQRFTTDGTYTWSAGKGKTATKAFRRIHELILQIIDKSQKQDWEAIDSIPFHSVGKWKIAFVYSNRMLLPIYARRALIQIAEGLGGKFDDRTPVSTLQKFILKFKTSKESIDQYAWRLYGLYATKKKERNYYIIGSKYGDEDGRDVLPQIDAFIESQCVAIGFLGHMDFSKCMGATADKVQTFVDSNWREVRPAKHKINRYFKLLSQIREGDIIAVKSHGAHNQLTIIAYAEVVSRNGSIYEHDPSYLGHQIHVDFLDARFHKKLGLTYAETIHKLTAKKDKEKFDQVFGWYADAAETTDEDVDGNSDANEEAESSWGDEGYNEKGENSFERSATASVKVKRLHNRIQNRFVRYLRESFEGKIWGEKNRVDIRRETSSEVIIYEIKISQDAYSCMREAIGQLLSYSHREDGRKPIRLMVVGPTLPDDRSMAFLERLKKILNLSIGYIAFDEAHLNASEF